MEFAGSCIIGLGLLWVGMNLGDLAVNIHRLAKEIKNEKERE